MKAWILILISVVVGILIWRCQSDPKPQTTSLSLKAPEEAHTAENRPLVKDESSTTQASLPRPDLSPAIDGPVSLRREPRQPGESDLQYELRTKFVVAFDWFRNESKISKEKEQQILAILGEAQQKLLTIIAYRDWALLEGGGRPEEYMRWGPSLAVDIATEAEQEIQDLLTPQEREIWNRYMLDLIAVIPLDHGQPLRIEPPPA